MKIRTIVALASLALGVLFQPRLSSSYHFLGHVWPNSAASLRLQLGCLNGPLTSGRPCWNDVATAAIGEWNAVSNFKFQYSEAPPYYDTCNFNDQVFPVSWSTTFCGAGFGDYWGFARVVSEPSGGPPAEGFVILRDDGYLWWDDYDGPIQGHSGAPSGIRADLHRLLLHEFGHVLGLHHPYEIGQQQHVIMNLSGDGPWHGPVWSLQPDDAAGARALYGPSSITPQLDWSCTGAADTLSDPNADASLVASVNGTAIGAVGMLANLLCSISDPRCQCLRNATAISPRNSDFLSRLNSILGSCRVSSPDRNLSGIAYEAALNVRHGFEGPSGGVQLDYSCSDAWAALQNSSLPSFAHVHGAATGTAGMLADLLCFVGDARCKCLRDTTASSSRNGQFFGRVESIVASCSSSAPSRSLSGIAYEAALNECGGTQAPRILNVDAPPQIECNAGSFPALVDFSDPNGDLVSAEFRVTHSTNGTWNDFSFDPRQLGVTLGSFSFGISCNAGSGFSAVVTIEVTLIDASNNRSPAVSFEFEAFTP